MERISLLLPAFIFGLVLGAIPLGLLWMKEKKRVRHDDLTGLPNYLNFVEKLKTRIRKINRKPVALVLIDLDDFQKYNARGYGYGDRMLVTFAERLIEETKNHAFCARYRMGDEFVMFFDASHLQMMESALRRLNNEEVPGAQIKFSYGCHVFHDLSFPIPSMMEKVEVLLMEKKDRNKKQ